VGRRWPRHRAGREGGDRAPRGTSVSSGWAGQADFTIGAEVAGRGLGPKAAKALFLFLSESFSDLNIHRNFITLLKCIENGIKLVKIQNKFL
jgi:hypothetical protein